VRGPDPRLDQLSAIFNSCRTVPMPNARSMHYLTTVAWSVFGISCAKRLADFRINDLEHNSINSGIS